MEGKRVRERVARMAWTTPVVALQGFDPPVHAKLESLQATGSFKVRGATNRLLALTPDERRRGVVACSSGNHGRAVAEAAAALGIPATICLPDWADPTKIQAVERTGARVVLAGATYDEAEARAARIASGEGRTEVHPFDDPDVIAGQGTIAAEILEQVPDVAEVLVPLSGGGLVGGIASALEDTDVRVVAVSAARAAVMHRSVREGKPVSLDEESTLASALSGGIGLKNAHTFDLVSRLVDDFLVVEEERIHHAVARAATELKLVVEGGGAVALAALWSGYRPSGPAVAVVSGGNIDLAALARVVVAASP